RGGGYQGRDVVRQIMRSGSGPPGTPGPRAAIICGDRCADGGDAAGRGVPLDTFLIFLLVGLLAQSVDGALGMAYGVVSNTVLLAVGVPPAAASASVHAAEIFTT